MFSPGLVFPQTETVRLCVSLSTVCDPIIAWRSAGKPVGASAGGSWTASWAKRLRSEKLEVRLRRLRERGVSWYVSVTGNDPKPGRCE